MKKVVVIGGGGHAKVVVEILRYNPDVKLVGYIDPNPQSQIAGLQHLGNDHVLPDLFANDVRHAFIAIGDNGLRNRIYQQVKNIGFELVNAVSPFSYISPSAVLGTGIAIMPGAVINAEARIGNAAIINTNASVDHESIIGQASHIAPGSSVAGKVKVGDGTFIGIGSKIIDGIEIGCWSILGAGAVVVHSVPDYSLAIGVPAKVKKSLEKKQR